MSDERFVYILSERIFFTENVQANFYFRSITEWINAAQKLYLQYRLSRLNRRRHLKSIL